MSWFPQSGITSCPCFPFVPVGVGTPKGFKVGSRGQGRAFCARRPRTALPLQGRDFFDGPLPWVATATHVAPRGEHGTVKPLRVALLQPVAWTDDSYRIRHIFVKR